MILTQFKIVFAGAMGAGKSAAIQALSETSVISTEALNTDVESHQKTHTTVGIDYGEIVLDDQLKIGLYGTPGQDRFDFIWAVICSGALGVVLMIDHSAPNPIADLEHFVEFFSQHSKNIVIAVSHVDEKTERSCTIYRDWQIAKNCRYPLFFIDARNKDDVLLLLEALIANVEVHLEKVI